MGNRDKIVPLFVPLLTINRLADIYKAVLRCPGREHFYMLIISDLLFFQAKTQAAFKSHKKSIINEANLGTRQSIFSICLN